MSDPTTGSLPSNIHVSAHPLLHVKLGLLRLNTTSSRETKSLIHDIATILTVEALSSLPLVVPAASSSSSSLQPSSSINNHDVSSHGPFNTIDNSIDAHLSNQPDSHIPTSTPTTYTHLGYPFTQPHIATSRLTLVPILRSGLAMVDAVQHLMPEPLSVHHLGLFRERESLQPVEYYNNLPQHRSSTLNSNSDLDSAGRNGNLPACGEIETAILLDPVIATGGTSIAAIQTLREWGVRKVIVLAVLGADEGVRACAEESAEGCEIEVWVGAVDSGLTDKGMICPGVGDIGDRLFGTIGK